MAFNYSNNNNPQDATTDQVWQNSIAFLQLLQQLDININEQLASGDLQQAVQYERQLLVILERLLKKKEENGRSEKFNTIMPLIREVQIDIAKTSNGNYDLATKKKRMQEEYEKIENIYLQLGDLMYELNLIFKQGIDPAEAWIDQ